MPLSTKYSSFKVTTEHICAYFRERDYGIGFDVFAPFLSLYVGQNLPALSGLCDFIKPMMYRATNAPAGLPFETEALLRECALEPSALGLSSRSSSPFDLDFILRDLEKLLASSSCPVYAGFEINRKEGIAPVYPAYIEETMRAYTEIGCQGLVLSWDLMDAPEENILKVSEIAAG